MEYYGTKWNNILKISILGIVYLREGRIFASQNGGLRDCSNFHVRYKLVSNAIVLRSRRCKTVLAAPITSDTSCFLYYSPQFMVADSCR
jgi:hypothetical protein